MKKNIQHLTFIALMLIAASIKAQNSIDNVLSEIAENNKSIIAKQQYVEAKKLQYSTGLTPYNPYYEYDYNICTPA